MKDYFKIVFSYFVSGVLNTNDTRNYFNSISDKWDVYIVKYNSNSLKYFTRPLHPDAYKLIIDLHISNTNDHMFEYISGITKVVYCWDDTMCDLLISNSNIYDNDITYVACHIIYGNFNIPEHRQLDMIRSFPNVIYYIAFPTDDAVEFSKFVNEL